MRTFKLPILIFLGILAGCAKLDLNPQSKGSVTTFYSNQKELELAVNALYTISYFPVDNEQYTDNLWSRTDIGNQITLGTITSDDGAALSYWTNAYTCIAQANTFLNNMHKATGTPESVMLNLAAEARTIRALQYAGLITHFGDVPFLDGTETLADSYQVERKNKNEILDFIFEELDWAAGILPAEYKGVKRITKGAALGIKARTALYMNKWEEARDAAKEVIDIAGTGVYALHSDYRELFLKTGGLSKEIIISLPRSEALGVRVSAVDPYIPNINGGWGALNPTWDLMVSYECIDGKPVDESPIYDPSKPFKNRDPRLAMTIVEFGTPWLGFKYEPHPDSLMIPNSSGTLVSNRNSRGANINAPWNGLSVKKAIDESWLDMAHDLDHIFMRYAEILLIYAEAKVALNEADQSVLNSINQVRARAYGVGVGDIGSYPEIISTDVSELKTLIKRERRVEFAMEGLRYMDLIRWRIAARALKRPVYGMPDPRNQDRNKWFFAGAPAIDADGIPDWTNLSADIKKIADRNFDERKQYLWPIPARERQLNNKLTQNDGY